MRPTSTRAEQSSWAARVTAVVGTTIPSHVGRVVMTSNFSPGPVTTTAAPGERAAVTASPGSREALHSYVPSGPWVLVGRAIRLTCERAKPAKASTATRDRGGGAGDTESAPAGHSDKHNWVPRKRARAMQATASASQGEPQWAMTSGVLAPL